VASAVVGVWVSSTPQSHLKSLISLWDTLYKLQRLNTKYFFSGFQFSERTIASIESNNTPAESPWFQLSFEILKLGVTLSGRRHARLPFIFLTPSQGFFDFLTSMTFYDTITFRVPNQSWDQGFFADVSFVSVLVLALSIYWKPVKIFC
jgi:hypothetical protein